ncbi:hypothetical protein FA13DRAFT_106160 [Coprinellus micaceus]|uniref:DUF1665 domain-containing protein n=1 Tax=Coprinellus micaceus TaxID=71717 RepID=A0A4Y7THM5_COPMI|nr:hypothetical protein FA13DRAFT_106160 [Coprinellus micaceus]
MKTITLRERTMLRFMNAVTDKPDWTNKVFDEAIVEKWRSEAVNDNNEIPEDEEGVPFDVEMTKAMFGYSIQELRYRAEQHITSVHGAVYALPGDIYKSDTAISNELKLALQEAVRPLEDAPESQKDWHPGSDGKVLDLVHPSLFPLIYGVSKVLPVGSKATTLEDCIKLIGHVRTSSGSPVKWTFQARKPRILTYINNLHPKHHSKLYNVIEEVIGAAIPSWELTLALANHGALYDAPRRIQYDSAEYHDGDKDGGEEDEHETYPQQEDDEEDEAFEVRWEAWDTARNERRRVILPEPPSEFNPNEFLGEPFTMMEKLGGRPLQVIVKLASIELTPDKPEYGGGSWHVEGMMNEAICATAIYYYSSENVTESRLAFRQQSHNFDYDDVSYEQEHHDWLHQVYGLRQHRDTVQDLGSVVTKEGRLLTFPNILQHQVQPFKLEDPTKPGHRKILALFLVDPHYSVISTADVPPQRHDWWAEETFGPAHELPSSTKMKELIELLPVELRDKVMDDMEDDFPITLEKAEGYREELMKERMKFQLAHDGDFSSVEISLCEH